MNERDMVIGGRIEARLDQLAEDVAELKGGFAQMDRRLTSLETAVLGVRGEMGEVRKEMGDLRKDVRQIIFVVLGTWVTLMLAILLKG